MIGWLREILVLGEGGKWSASEAGGLGSLGCNVR